jgi:hypothetical protein
MITSFAAVRRVALCVLALVVWGAAGNALAQDPRAAEAQKAARAWLELVDKLDANASFAAAGARFREPITSAEWADAMAKGRAPLGAVVQRAVAETAFDKAKSDNGAEFEVALVRYRTSFAKKVDISETITLEHDPNGVWRVIGYLIR